MAASLAVFGSGSTVAIRTAEAPGRARIVLLFDDPVRIESHVDGREFLLRADGTREMPDALEHLGRLLGREPDNVG